MEKANTATVSPRKEAKQRRSKVKVEHILDTTLKMMSEAPTDKVTTNAIAKRAGISIGSLYQFFPNKEAIFYELFQRWLAQTLNALDSVDKYVEPHEPREKFIDALLEALAGNSDINSKGHWQLRRAMGSSRELAELEAKHLQEILHRIVSLHAKFGQRPPPELEAEFALLQNQISIACLQVLALTDKSPNRERVLGWCKAILLLAFDYENLG